MYKLLLMALGEYESSNERLGPSLLFEVLTIDFLNLEGKLLLQALSWVFRLSKKLLALTATADPCPDLLAASRVVCLRASLD